MTSTATENGMTKILSTTRPMCYFEKACLSVQQILFPFVHGMQHVLIRPMLLTKKDGMVNGVSTTGRCALFESSLSSRKRAAYGLAASTERKLVLLETREWWGVIHLAIHGVVTQAVPRIGRCHGQQQQARVSSALDMRRAGWWTSSTREVCSSGLCQAAGVWLAAASTEL